MDKLSFYSHLSRRKPGSIVFTSTYLTPLPLDRHSTLAEVGCGYGHRATWVARSRCCKVHAFDQNPSLLEQTHIRSEEGGSEELIELHLTKDYLKLNLAPQSIDLLMAEGVGFDLDSIESLNHWIPYVRSGGHIVITSPGVINKHPPRELVEPLVARLGRELGTLEDYHEMLSQYPVRLVHQATLSSHAWDEHYQNCARLVQGLIKSSNATHTDEWILNIKEEIEWYRKYGRNRVFLQAFVLAVQ